MQTDRQAHRTYRQTNTDTHTQKETEWDGQPEAAEGSFQVGGRAHGSLLVLAVVCLQCLIPPVQLLVPAFLQATAAGVHSSSLQVPTEHALQDVYACMFVYIHMCR